MTKQAKIITRNVGQAHGCEAIVKAGRKIVYTTRLYPFGQRANAYAAAEAWAADHGYITGEAA